MEVTGDLYNFNLFAKVMVLLRQILFNLAIAATAEVILMWSFAESAMQLVTSAIL